ncbi:MAG: hypothetical protein E6Q97_12720 [Desulfurellales bacterium]|nr:MAG: hypothetical protein E6Q97_12720 [Desulfurellales bacterium]
MTSSTVTPARLEEIAMLLHGSGFKHAALEIRQLAVERRWADALDSAAPAPEWEPTEGPGSGDDKYAPRPATETCPAPESSTDPGEGEWPPLMRAEDVNRMYQDGGAWQVGVALDSPDEGFHWLPLNEVACSREDEPFLPEWPNLLVVAAPWKGRAAMPTPRPGEGEATADGEQEHATASMTGAERYLADRMADPEYAAAYAAALPEVPDGYEIVVLPTEVVDEWAHRGPVLTDRDIATVGACQAAVDRRPKPAPETERVRAMEAVEDRRKVVHPTGPFEAEAIMWIEGEMAVCEYGGPAAPIDSDGTVEVLVDGES